MEIRPATVTDAERVAFIHIRSWQAAYRGLIRQDYLDGLDETFDRRVEWWTSQANGPGVFLVGETDAGELAGFASAGRAREDHELGELYAIYLLAEAWGSGLGAPLLEGATDRLRESGYDEAILWVLDSNGRARRFYEKHGWHSDGGAKIELWGDLALSEVRYRRAL